MVARFLCRSVLIALLMMLDSTSTLAQSVSFIARRDFAVGTRPESIAAGDFNGDGIADLAVGDHGLSILLGKEGGTFNEAVETAPGTHFDSVAVGDFDR